MKINCVYLEDFSIQESDLHKAVEAQGCIAVAAIKQLIDGMKPEQSRADITAWLNVLAMMLKAQGEPTRHCFGVALYEDGSPVFRLVPDGTADVEAKLYLDDADEVDLEDADDDFPFIGDLAEHLFTNMPGYRPEVNEP